LQQREGGDTKELKSEAGALFGWMREEETLAAHVKKSNSIRSTPNKEGQGKNQTKGAKKRKVTA